MKPFQEKRVAMMSWWIGILLIAAQIDTAFTQNAQYPEGKSFVDIYATKQTKLGLNDSTCIRYWLFHIYYEEIARAM